MAITTAPMPKSAARTARERIDVRLRAEQKAFIEKAAHIKGLTVTDFILQQALESAERVVREHETWTLARPDAELFAEALMKPPSTGGRLASAARRYKEQILQQ
jgi:uncharacterized protein (DUF1778 family)